MLNGTILWRVVIATIIIAAALLWQRTRSHYVIGDQLAQAQRAERARLAKPNVGASPLPASVHYDRWRGDFDLSNPKAHPLDNDLHSFCQQFSTAWPAARSRLRDSASMDDFYTLINFSRRSSVFAMRDRKTEHLVDGLTAIAVIDPTRVDPRDALSTLSLLYHSAKVIGADMDDLFGQASLLAEPRMSDWIQGFPKRTEQARDIRKFAGYTVVQTEDGPGFVRWGLEPYAPSYPLDQIGLSLARMVNRDKYDASVALGQKLPPIWLSGVDDEILKAVLRSARGGLIVNADLRPQESRDYQGQALMIFVVELQEKSGAEALMRLAGQKQARANGFAMITASRGPIFCLAIARSVMGKPPYESQESIRRLSAGIASSLQNPF